MMMSDEVLQGLAIGGAALGAVGVGVGLTALVRETNDRKAIRSLETRTGVLEARPTFTDAEGMILRAEADDLARRLRERHAQQERQQPQAQAQAQTQSQLDIQQLVADPAFKSAIAEAVQQAMTTTNP